MSRLAGETASVYKDVDGVVKNIRRVSDMIHFTIFRLLNNARAGSFAAFMCRNPITTMTSFSTIRR